MKKFPGIKLRFTTRINKLWVSSALRVGGPMYLRSAFNSLGIMIQYAIVNSFSIVATSAYTIGFLFMDIAEVVARGSTTPIAIIIGQNLGANNTSKAKFAAVKLSIALAASTAIASSILLLIKKNLVKVFTQTSL